MNTIQELRDETIIEVKKLRVEIFATIEKINHLAKRKPEGIAEIILAKRAAQQSRHWLGEALGEMRDADPYPKGNDVSTIEIDPRADV